MKDNKALKYLTLITGVLTLLLGVYTWSYVKKKYKLNTTNFLFLCNC